MVDQQPHVSVEQGDGLVARFGDFVVLVAQTDAAEAAVEEVLEAVEAAAADSGAPGATVATRLAAIVVARAAGVVPPFGVVAPLEDTMVVFLHGHVWADITGTEGSEWISGQQAVTWVDHIARAPVRLLSVGSGESPVKADPRSDLRAGRGAGQRVRPDPGGLGGRAAGRVGRRSADDVVARGPADRGAGRRAGGGGGGGVRSRSRAGGNSRANSCSRTGRCSGTSSCPEPTGGAHDRAAGGTGARATIVPAADTAPAEPQPKPEPEPQPQPAAAAPAPGAVPANATVFVTQPVGFLVAADGMRIPLDRGYVLGRSPRSTPPWPTAWPAPSGSATRAT